jgi:transposase-like protein
MMKKEKRPQWQASPAYKSRQLQLRRFRRTHKKKVSNTFLKLRPFSVLQLAALYIQRLEETLISHGDAVKAVRKLMRAYQSGSERLLVKAMKESAQFMEDKYKRRDRRHHAPEFKLEVLRTMSHARNGTKQATLKQLGITHGTWKKWLKQYDTGGVDELCGYNKYQRPHPNLMRIQLTHEQARGEDWEEQRTNAAKTFKKKCRGTDFKQDLLSAHKGKKLAQDIVDKSTAPDPQPTKRQKEQEIDNPFTHKKFEGMF